MAIFAHSVFGNGATKACLNDDVSRKVRHGRRGRNVQFTTAL